VGRRAILVDGYNLMFRDGTPDDASLADVREAFLRRVDAARATNEDVVVVFDGGPAGASSGAVADGLRVVFAGRRSADDAIVALVEKAPRGQVLVLTRDRELGHRVKSAGGRLGDPDAFFRRPERPPRGRAGPRGGKPPSPRGAELELWERLFREHDPDA